MRVVKIGPPWVMYLAVAPLILGALFAAADRWTPALTFFTLGFAVHVGGGVLFARRVSKLRAASNLTSRDRVDVEYPRWARRAATGYLTLFAAMTGILILFGVIFVVVAVATQ